MIEIQNGYSFEAEVRRIARLLWPTRAYHASTSVDGRERDAFIETDDAIHIVEATTELKAAKAASDLEKTSKLVGRLRKERPDKVVKGWFITKHELTADQADIAKKYERTVTAIPYKTFVARLIDAPEYLRLRTTRPFGSVADPFEHHFDVRRDSYVAPFFWCDELGKTLTFDEFAGHATSIGARTVLTGDFGAGKSMTLREIFFQMCAIFNRDRSTRFPVYLNLRGHAGQSSPTEALIREATNSGYARYDDLVKAWRADLCCLILDGFDELVTPVWTQKAAQLREHRAACVKLVSEFISESPRNTPIIISGRLSYFGSVSEMDRTLRLYGNYRHFQLNDFNRQQAENFLRKLNLSGSLPSWLPPRPLLLGYIAALASKSEISLPMQDIDAATGWDFLFDQICEREAAIHTGLFKEYVRRVIERIGTKSRYRPDITHGISQVDIASAFSEVFGRPPDDQNLGMLLRLPGMVGTDSPNEDRRFVDSDFATIAAAGDVYEFVQNPKGESPDVFESCVTNIETLGAEFVTSKLSRSCQQGSLVLVALESLEDPARYSVLKGDLLIALAQSDVAARERWTTVTQATIGTLDLQSCPGVFRRMRIYDSVFDTLEIEESHAEDVPEFYGCLIDTVRGPRDGAVLKGHLFETEIRRFEHEAITNNAILELAIPDGVKLGLTVLRKLYVQAGGGRAESAFSRGIKPEHRKLVSGVLEVIVSHDFARVSNRSGEAVYLKNSDKLTEARDLVLGRGATRAPLIDALTRLK